MKLYKYQGAGNDFLLIDNRDGSVTATTAWITSLCDRHYGIGADGLMFLESAEDGYDFKMDYYNSDGSGGMMCGNGGRCIVAFAAHLGVIQAKEGTRTSFLAPDGAHKAEILSCDGAQMTVRLQMKDVSEINEVEIGMEAEDGSIINIQGIFMDTGTRHLVIQVYDLPAFEVVNTGRALRYSEAFAPIGTNVNFIEPSEDDKVLNVRTYEKGVEDETFACGTGITASAIAYRYLNDDNYGKFPVKVHTGIKALRDNLAVDFTTTPKGAKNVHLTGPATRVATIVME